MYNKSQGSQSQTRCTKIAYCMYLIPSISKHFRPDPTTPAIGPAKFRGTRHGLSLDRLYI